MSRFLLIGLLVVFEASLAFADEGGAARNDHAFQLADGDRVVLLGNTFWERELRDGYLETALTASHPDQQLTFRNLARSGDTVFGDAWTYSSSHSDDKNVADRLLKLIEQQRPTVIVVNFGAVESFAGPSGLDRWRKGLNEFLAKLKPLGARIVLMRPAPREDASPALPNVEPLNANLQQYAGVMRDVAAIGGHEWFDPFQQAGRANSNDAQSLWTVNGMHYTSAGYWRLARRLQAAFRSAPANWQVEIAADAQTAKATGTDVTELSVKGGRIEFTARDTLLPLPPLGGMLEKSRIARGKPPRVLRLRGLPKGQYELQADGKSLLESSAAEWEAGVRLDVGPSHDQVEALRQAIVEKNRLFFNHWRPLNETYLFGFRKPEQGRHAVERKAYQELTAAADAQIAELRAPKPHRYRIVPAQRPRETVQPKATPNNAPEKTVPEETLPPVADLAQIAKELKAFRLADGFQISLFASEPMIANPIGMNWDEHGRLWVATSPIYPQIVPGDKPNDKIIILEDTDGDGRADKRTVFADGLLVPTSVLPGDGGAYVTNARELLHLKDTDGDGRADQTRVLLSGFGTQDTHHIIHRLHWGPDGRIYFYQSVLIFSHVETPWGVQRLGRAGLWQFDPRTHKLDVLFHGLVNPWGHRFDRWGQSFATDGADGKGINYAFPGARFFWARNTPRFLTGLNTGQPKECGLEILSGRHVPDAWRDRLITADFRAGRIVSFQLSEDRSGYLSKQTEDLIPAGHSQAFRPVDMKMGPDGAIYICDWFNPIIQHGEVDFRDPRRDHLHGRIWRMTANQRPLVKRPQLAGATTTQLLDALKLPEAWSREQARRLLKQQGAAAVLPALNKWLAGLDSTDPNHEHHRLEALWLYQSLDRPNPELLASLLTSPDHRARAAAVRVLSDWNDRVPDVMDRLAAEIKDDHPRVRLEAISALRRVGSPSAVQLAMSALDFPMDSNLDFALWLTARELQDKWLPLFRAGELTFGGRVRQATFALSATGNPAVAGELLSRLQEGKIGPDSRDSVIHMVAALGNPNELSQLFQLGVSANDAFRAAVFTALLDAARRRGAAGRPSGDLTSLLPHVDGDPVAVRLAGRWKLPAVRKKITALAHSPDTPHEMFTAAVESVAALGGAASVETLQRIAADDAALPRRTSAAAALAALDLPKAAGLAVEILSAESLSHALADNLFNALLDRRDGPQALANNLADRKIPKSTAARGAQLASAHGGDVQDLIKVLIKAGGLEPLTQQLDTKQMRALIDEIHKQGDPKRGESIYRREALGCVKCHALGGQGGRVGPDLMSLGGSAPVDYIVQSLLEPSAKIKENYHASVIELDNGRVLTGVVVQQSDQQVVLRDAQDKLVTVRRDEIEEQTTSSVSMMPAGLMTSLRRDELIDLVRFLSELGKTARK